MCTKSCQICTFIYASVSSAVFKLTVSDILAGKSILPFSSPQSWKASQHDCPALQRTYAHLTQGTRSSKKVTSICDVKRYLQVCTLGTDNLLVSRKHVPFNPSRDLIVIPHHGISGLLSALHLRLQHPSKSQLLKVFHRFFYALDVEKVVEHVTEQCAFCASMASIPQEVEFTTTSTIPTLGSAFACDILRSESQVVLQ